MTRDPRRVFLNVPFDSTYEPTFIGLVAALISGFSVHDLSRVRLSGQGRGAVPRFNMPFELGLAVGVARLLRTKSAHVLALLEARPYRLQRSLSDMKGFDPMIHNGTRAGAVRSIFEIFAGSRPIDLQSALRLARKLTRVSKQLKRDRGVRSVFSRVMLIELFAAATLLREQG